MLSGESTFKGDSSFKSTLIEMGQSWPSYFKSFCAPVENVNSLVKVSSLPVGATKEVGLLIYNNSLPKMHMEKVCLKTASGRCCREYLLSTMKSIGIDLKSSDHIPNIRVLYDGLLSGITADKEYVESTKIGVMSVWIVAVLHKVSTGKYDFRLAAMKGPDGTTKTEILAELLRNRQIGESNGNYYYMIE